jgi:energy-converting hydrogenase Eha subunit B
MVSALFKALINIYLGTYITNNMDYWYKIIAQTLTKFLKLVATCGLKTWYFIYLFIVMSETISQNFGHKRAYCSSPEWYMSMESRGDDDAGWG